MTDKLNIRFVKVSGASYLRLEDVVRYLTELASTEDTDVRERFKLAAENLKDLT